MNSEQLEMRLKRLGMLEPSHEDTEVTIPTEARYVEGSLDSDLAIIGEAAGKNELQEGRPFVGAAGNILNDILRVSGISRSSVYLDNVFQFKPEGNNIEPFLEFKRNGTVKESSVYKHSRDALKERLSQSKANVFVAAGKVPLYTLTGKTSSTKYRGSILESTLLPGRKVIPIIHPAAALPNRNPMYKYYIEFDFRLIRKQKEFPEIKLLDRNLIIKPSFFEVMYFIEECHKHPLVAIDIEVTGWQVSHLSLAYAPDQSLCIPFYDEGRDYFTPDREAEVWIAVANLLQDESVAKVGHNITFDFSFLYNTMGIRIRPVEDTFVGMKIMFPDLKHGLDMATSLYCEGEPYYKDDGKMWFKNPFGSTDIFRRYNAMDSAVLMEILPKLKEDLRRLGNLDTYNHQVKLIEPLVFMQAKGIRMDVQGLAKAAEECRKKIEAKHKELNDAVGFEINYGSPVQVKDYFYGKLKIKPYYKIKKDKGRKVRVITCDNKALKKIAVVHGRSEALLITDLRHLRKMLGTYFEVKLDGDHLHCSYNPVGTIYGRLSSGQTIYDTGANLQNQPKEMKLFMYPELGNIYVEVDLSQAENRTVAYMWNVVTMMDAFATKKDVHKRTAGLIFNKPEDEISKEVGSTEIGDGRFSERDIGKKANHGFNYGEGPDTFAMNNEIDIEDAEAIHAKYHLIYPELKQAHRAIQEELRATKTLVNIFGRRYMFLRPWGPDLFEAAYAFQPQSTVADIINRRGMIPLYYNQNSAIMTNQIHDSIVFEFPIAKGAKELQLILMNLCRSLEIPITWKTRTFSIPADVCLGFNLGKYDKEKNPRGMKEFKSSDVYNTETFISIVEEIFATAPTE